jgi:hypothetical protein
MRRGLIAFLVGVFLAWAVPVVIALVAAAPGLGTLIRSIRVAGVPLPGLYFAITNLLPALLFSFGIGCAMFRILAGGRGRLFVASAAPWVLNALYFYVDLCVEAEASCLTAYELSGLTVVPLGLLLAALIAKPPSRNGSVNREPDLVSV